MRQRGGKRTGAGRKPSTIKGVVKRLPGDVAALVLCEIKAQQKWVELANSEDERIRLETPKYLTDRAFGKPAQTFNHQGEDDGPLEIVVRHIGRGH